MRRFFMWMLILVAPCGATTLYNNTACGDIYYEGSCNITQAATQGGNTALDWVQISGEADDYNVDTEGLTEQAGMIISGNGSGTLATATVIPISWDFNVTGGAGCPIPSEPTNCDDITWSLSVSITTSGGNGYYSTYGSLGTTADNTPVQGSAMLTIPAGTFTGEPEWQVEIGVGGVFANTPIQIEIPSGSTFDLNPVLPASAPEPGTVVLTGGAVLALIFYRKRRRSADC